LEEGALDELAFAGAFAVEEGGADGHADGDASGVIGDGRGEALRFAVGSELAIAGDETGVGSGCDIGSAGAGHGAERAEAGEVSVDQTGVDCFEGVIVDAEALGDAGAVVDGDDIDLRDDVVEELAAFFGGEIDGETALTAVERLEALALAGDDGTGITIGVAGEWFDLDDVCTEIGEKDAVERHGDDE
jgi:hypothetical protein